MNREIRSRRTGRKKKNSYKMIALVMLVLFVVLSYGSYSGYRELKSLQQQYDELTDQQLEEEERAAELEERKAYMQTISYLIEVAREKLGLVFPEDTIMRQEKEE